MDLRFANLPNTKTAKDFEKMFMAGFTPLKNHIQYNKLEGKLTEDDLHLFAHALAAGMMHWCEFLKRANAEANERRGGDGF